MSDKMSYEALERRVLELENEALRAEESLQKAHDELERRVRERTADQEKANEELRRVPLRLMAILEEERKRLATELQESIAQTLAAIKYRVEAALSLKDERDGSAAFNHLDQLVPILQRSIEEIRTICMSLLNGTGGIKLVIADDGIGLDLDLVRQNTTAKTLGMTGMRERVELLGGCFEIESTSGEGTTIRACWPIER